MRAGQLDPGESYELVGLPRPAGALPITGRRADAPLDLARTALPPVLRPGAGLVVLDVTEFYGETSGGVRTYLDRKAAYVAAHPALRQVVVVPGARDAVGDGDGVRCYQLRGARVPMRPPVSLHARPAPAAAHRRARAPRTSSRSGARGSCRGSCASPPSACAVAPSAAPTARAACRSCTSGTATIRDSSGAATARARGASPRTGWSAGWHGATRVRSTGCSTSPWSPRRSSRASWRRPGSTGWRACAGGGPRALPPRRRAHAPVTRAAYGLPLGLPIGLYVGRFAADKRIDVVLDAWRVVRQRTGAALVLVGGGPEEARLRAHPEAARATWLPFERDRERLADLMAAVDVQVAPGPLETFGLAVLEGMASGTPVVAVDAGAAAELVARSGGGRCFAPGDAASLADAVVAVLDGGGGGAARARAGGPRARAEREHAWETVFDALFGLHAAVAHGAWARPGRAP
jgi:alpha-1,6-mannosyltransferase